MSGLHTLSHLRQGRLGPSHQRHLVMGTHHKLEPLGDVALDALAVRHVDADNLAFLLRAGSDSCNGLLCLLAVGSGTRLTQRKAEVHWPYEDPVDVGVQNLRQVGKTLGGLNHCKHDGLARGVDHALVVGRKRASTLENGPGWTPRAITLRGIPACRNESLGLGLRVHHGADDTREAGVEVAADFLGRQLRDPNERGGLAHGLQSTELPHRVSELRHAMLTINDVGVVLHLCQDLDGQLVGGMEPTSGGGTLAPCASENAHLLD
mmetsp:Transcript_117021/g.376365  ORF Transcript_117021/g.376365 Transcript_117021/m.376365 type:complete len:264 (+) Transcript_117021:1130-1921(+)